ncbi:MAG: ABC transporter ATP-binding protein [Clostridia bacterium]|nr:ABC transporter ATP-binding protein [Clostridia bacterium]
MIEAQGVSKRYGAVWALNDVSLRAPEGSVVGLLGQNGAGKTTLLRIMTGYLAATSGQVLIGGADPLLSPMEAKSRLGYMPEHPPLYDEMTVWEYLCFVSRLKGVCPGAVRDHVRELMELTGLADRRDRLLGHLSKGYRQRAGLAQALSGDPEVLILDEPTSGLDPKQITEIRRLMKELSNRRTILFSSHMLSEVQQLCDHVVILNRGRVKLDMSLGRLASVGDAVLLCWIRGRGEELLSALRRMAGIREVRIEPAPGPEITSVTLAFHGAERPEEALFALLSGLAMPILRLQRQESSLEQVFLDAISE